MANRPVYWKPRYPTRVMRERAFAKAQLEREAALRAAPRGPRWHRRVIDWIARRR